MLIELKKMLRQVRKSVLEEFSYSGMSTVELRENLLSTWIENQNQCSVPEIKLLVQIKAHSIYEDLSQDSDNAKPLNASSGWFCNFAKRCNFYNITMRGEGAFYDTVTVGCLLRNCSIILKNEVTHLNKF